MTRRDDWLEKSEEISSNTEIIFTNETRIPVHEIRNNALKVGVKGKQNTVSVKEILFVPEITTNLLSIIQITKHGNKVNFDNKSCRIFDDQGHLFATGTRKNSMYELDLFLQLVLFTSRQKMLITSQRGIEDCYI